MEQALETNMDEPEEAPVMPQADSPRRAEEQPAEPASAQPPAEAEPPVSEEEKLD